MSTLFVWRIIRTISTTWISSCRGLRQTESSPDKPCDKATSNICTAQVLLAVMAGAYGVYHGPEGLMDIAESIHLRTATLNAALKGMNLEQSNVFFFGASNARFHPRSDGILGRAGSPGRQRRSWRMGFRSRRVSRHRHSLLSSAQWPMRSSRPCNM